MSKFHLLIGAAALAFGSPALAQTPPPPSAEVLRFETPQRDILLDTARPANCPLPTPAADGPVLTDVIWAPTTEAVGARVGDDIAAGQQALMNKPVDAAAADRLAAYVDCVHAREGYVLARSRIEQRTPGNWRIVTNEGVVGRIEVAGADADQTRFILKAYGGIPTDRPLNISDLRRGADTASRFGYWGVTPTPRLETDGTYVLVLTVTPGPPGLFVSAQNASAETVGTWSGGASLIFGGLTPLEERTIIGAFHDLTGSRQRGLQISTQVLLTDGGLELKQDLAVFEQRPDERPPNLDTVGLTTLGRWDARHPLGGSGDWLVAGRGGFEAINQDTDLTTGPATVRDRLRIGYVGLQMDYRSRGVTAGGFVSLRKGFGGLGASEAGDPLLSRPQGDPQAFVLRFDGQAQIRGEGFLIEPRLRAQRADKPLLQFEEFTYGGLVGGRALDPGALYGDSGISAAVDIFGPQAALGSRLAIRPAFFVEGAWAWNQDTVGPDEMRGSFAGGGVRFSLDGRWNLDVLYATPVGDTVGVPDQFVGPKVSVGISGGFSF